MYYVLRTKPVARLVVCSLDVPLVASFLPFLLACSVLACDRYALQCGSSPPAMQGRSRDGCRSAAVPDPLGQTTHTYGSCDRRQLEAEVGTGRAVSALTRRSKQQQQLYDCRKPSSRHRRTSAPAGAASIGGSPSAATAAAAKRGLLTSESWRLRVGLAYIGSAMLASHWHGSIPSAYCAAGWPGRVRLALLAPCWLTCLLTADPC
jgi:hypothetical protein